MNAHKGLLDIVLLLIVGGAYGTSLLTVSADPSSELGVEISNHVFFAGTNNTVTLRVWNRGKYLSNLDVSINVPPPLALFGDSRWIRATFKGGDTIEETLTIFAPNSAAGQTLQISVTAVYKEAGEDTFSNETHLLGVLVRGWIDLIVYELTVDPDPVVAGRSVTISGNVLNRGIIAAMFTNVTIEGAEYLELSSQSVSYIGQVDPNAPAPFSITVFVRPTAPEASLPLTVLVNYRNDLHETLTYKVSTQVQVIKTAPPPPGPQQKSILDLLLGEYLLPFLSLVVVFLGAAAILIRRRRRKQTQF